MQIHTLLTVKKAAAALGLDKKIIREKLSNGEMRGERRRVGEKEKWFVYQGEVQNLLDNQGLPSPHEKAERVSTEGMTEFFDDGAESMNANTGTFGANPQYANADPQHISPNQPYVTPNPQDLFEDAQYVIAEAQNIALHSSASRSPLAAVAHVMPYLEEYLHQLTGQFASHLALERAHTNQLQRKLTLKNEMLRKMSGLEQKLRHANESIQTKDIEIWHLKVHILSLETDLAKARRPWWQKILAYET